VPANSRKRESLDFGQMSKARISASGKAHRPRVRRLGASLLLAAGFVIVNQLSASPAEAALCVSLTLNPAQLAAGEQGQLELRTYFPIRNGHGQLELRPGSVPSNFPFRVTAEGPSGGILAIPMHRSVDRDVWTGPVVFHSAGTWIVRVLNFEPGGTAPCYSSLHVVIVTGGAAAHPTKSADDRWATYLLAVTLVAVSVALAGAVAAVMWRRRHRKLPRDTLTDAVARRQPPS